MNVATGEVPDETKNFRVAKDLLHVFKYLTCTVTGALEIHAVLDNLSS